MSLDPIERHQTYHVADGTHTRAGDRLSAWTEVLDDSTSTTLDSEDASDLEDDIYIIISFWYAL